MMLHQDCSFEDTEKGGLGDSISTRNGHNSIRSVTIPRRPSAIRQSLLGEYDPNTNTFCRYRRRVAIACDDELFMRETSMNHVRFQIGLYKNYPLAQTLLSGATAREKILKEQGIKQTDHIKGTDGWMKSMCALEPRCFDNILVPWTIVTVNAVITTFLHTLADIHVNTEALQHWDTVYSLVLKTSLAFLLVFRLNRCAVRYWETRTMWGNVTRISRSLVSTILTHCSHDPHNRDNAIRWTGAFCVACMHFIRRETHIPSAELAGFLKRQELNQLESAEHEPLYVTSQILYYLRKALKVDESTRPGIAHARTVHMNYMEQMINDLIGQVSGMERIRSTPLPVVYTSHLRTFLFIYLFSLPYIWVMEWGNGTPFLVAFTAFALFGIEGASSEVEIPFNKQRANHLALDAYCVTILFNIQNLVIHEANLDMQEEQDNDDDDDKSLTLGQIGGRVGIDC